MPLGVFAVSEENATDSGMLLQLAVSKEGIIAGTYYNDVTGSSRPVEGTVDQKTQRRLEICGWQEPGTRDGDRYLQPHRGPSDGVIPLRSGQNANLAPRSTTRAKGRLRKQLIVSNCGERTCYRIPRSPQRDRQCEAKNVGYILDSAMRLISKANSNK